MDVLVLDARWPTQIPLDALGKLGGPVSFTDEVPVSVRWDIDKVVAPEGTGVLVTTDPATLQRIDGNKQVYIASSISDPVARAVAAMAAARRIGEWEARQTHETLVPFLREETDELIEAIGTGVADEMRDELGDVLLQVLFHAEISPSFSLSDVAQSIVDKLEKRAPYLFDGTTEMVDEETQHRLWQRGKYSQQ